MTYEELYDRINVEGCDRIVFNAPMVKTADDISTVDIVPCKIDKNKYDPLDGFKIALYSMIPNYDNKTYYIGDFVSLINSGTIKIRGDLKNF